MNPISPSKTGFSNFLISNLVLFMKHTHLVLAIALYGTILSMPLLAQETARPQMVDFSQKLEEEPTKPPTEKEDDYPIIDCIIFTIGPQTFSGNVEETLNPSSRVSGLESYYALPFLRMLRIGINALDIGGSLEYLLTPSEKDAISSRYEIVTYTGYGDFKTVKTREPLTEVSASISRLSFIARLYPISKGISLSSSMKADIEPFIGAGVAHHSLTANLPAIEGITKEKGSGFSTFLNAGIDYLIGEKPPFFIRLEYLKGRLPDWNVKLLPELRAIKGGEYSMLKFGMGLAIRKRSFR